MSDAPATKSSLMLSLLKWPAIVVLVAFVASEVLTDSIHALQWVWFVPRPLLAGGALIWSIAALGVVRACGRRRPEARALWVVAALSGLGVSLGLAQMWGIPKERPADALRVVHWNPSYPVGEEVPDGIAEAVLALDADIVVLTDPGMLVVGERARRFAEAGYELFRPGRFAVLSRLPVREAVPIVAAKRGSASRIAVETRFGPIAIRAIDLPSDPRLSRRDNSRELAKAVESVDSSVPDMLVGDFNTPGGSASLRVFGSGFEDAFARHGSGWGGTYPREYPLWRIDLALVRAPWRVLRAEVVDLKGKRHNAQVIDLRRDTSPP